MATKFQNTGTATDYLGYEDYRDTAGYDYIDRMPSARQTWVFGDWDGEKYVIRFDKNFSKKHLFTFEKKKDNIEKAAYYIATSGSGGTDSENWGRAEHQLLESGIAYKLTHRTSQFRKCTCGHQIKRHPALQACNVAGCACARFLTVYGTARVTAGRTDADPLIGAPTTKNTCIVLNYIPKIEFESVVVGSICAHEKPPGWTRGKRLDKNVGDEVMLRWDFGSQRRGVIVQADTTVAPGSWPKLQGVYVTAKKIETAIGWQTWQVFHLETSGAHAPF